MLNSNKDLFYENLPIRFIELVEDFKFVDSSEINITS